MSFRIRLLIGSGFLILIFIVSFIVNQQLSKEVLTNTEYLNQSEQVIRTSNVLSKEIIEMQSGFRGFLLTDQESFLQPYYEGRKNVPSFIQELRSIASEAQQFKIDSIDILHKKWIVYADSLINSKKDSASAKIYEQLFTEKLKMEVGKKMNDRINMWFVSFDNYEYDLRIERRARLQYSIKRTGNISLALIVICILLGILSSLYIIRVISGRIREMVGLAERISRGDFITIEETRKDELSKLVTSLNIMSQNLNTTFSELRKKNNELDQFAYVVSHDLKAPLRGISNIISWIEEDNQSLDPDVSKNLMLIKGRTERLENMINGLLEYSRIGRIKKGTELIDLEKVILEQKELLVPSHTKFTVKNKLPVIEAERVHIEHLFANLISNAVKHNNNASPEISIDCKDKGNYYEFSVTDNGPGIEKQYFEKIFQIFQTLQERDAFESTGVGLAIVKKIIEDNKGTIRAESEPGKGTTFIFTWPKKK